MESADAKLFRICVPILAHCLVGVFWTGWQILRKERHRKAIIAHWGRRNVHEKRGKVGVGAVSVCVSGKGMEHRGGDQYFHYFTVHSPIEFSSTAYSPVDNGMDGRHKVWYTEGVYDSHDAPCYSTSVSVQDSYQAGVSQLPLQPATRLAIHASPTTAACPGVRETRSDSKVLRVRLCDRVCAEACSTSGSFRRRHSKLM